MKYFFIIIASFILTMELLAQDTTSEKSFASVDLKLSTVQGSSAYMFGARGGWIIGQSFSIGLAGCWAVVEDPVINIMDNREYYIRLVYGGLYLESKCYSYSCVHLIFSAILGGGFYGHSPVKSDYEIDWIKHKIFVIEPEIIVMFDISNTFKIGVGTSYRYIPGVDLTKFKNTQLNAPSIILTFRFVAI